MRRSYIFILFLLPYLITAQGVKRDSILFTGVVFESDSMKPLVAAHFLINKSKGGITDREGHFYFHATTGDIIQFSYMGYKTVLFIIGDTLPGIDYLLGIRMTKDTIPLKEVIIYPRIIGDIKTVMTNTRVDSRRTQNAAHNLQIAVYQGITNQNKEWDAEMNQKYVLDQYNKENMNQGLIPQDQMINFTAVIPFTVFAIKQINKEEKLPLKISKEEENTIKSLFMREIETKW